MDTQIQLTARWKLLRQGRIVLLIGALIFIIFGGFSPGSFVGQIGAALLLLAIPVGLWEKSTRKQAGIEPAKRPSLRSTVEENKERATKDI